MKDLELARRIRRQKIAEASGNVATAYFGPDVEAGYAYGLYDCPKCGFEQLSNKGEMIHCANCGNESLLKATASLKIVKKAIANITKNFNCSTCGTKTVASAKNIEDEIGMFCPQCGSVTEAEDMDDEEIDIVENDEDENIEDEDIDIIDEDDEDIDDEDMNDEDIDVEDDIDDEDIDVEDDIDDVEDDTDDEDIDVEDDTDVEDIDVEDDTDDEDMNDEDIDVEDIDVEDDTDDEDMNDEDIDVEDDTDDEDIDVEEVNSKNKEYYGYGDDEDDDGIEVEVEDEDDDEDIENNEEDDENIEVGDDDMEEAESKNTIEFITPIEEASSCTIDDIQMAFYQGEDPTWTVLIKGSPLATIKLSDQPRAEEIAEMFSKDEYAQNVAQAMVQCGANEVLEQVKAKFFANKIDETALAGRMADKVRAEMDDEFKSKVAGLQDEFKSCIAVVLAGMNKNFWRDVDNPLKASLFNNLKDLGVSDPSQVIESAFADGANPYFDIILAKSVDFMNKSPEAREEIANAISESNTIMASTNKGVIPESQKLVERLSQNNVIAHMTGTNNIDINNRNSIKDTIRLGKQYK